MPSVQAVITDRISTKLDVGDLPRIGPEKMWAGFGSNDACDGCGQRILKTDIEYKFNLGDKRTCRISAVPDSGRPSCKRRGLVDLY
jgi:hypothetical protein